MKEGTDGLVSKVWKFKLLRDKNRRYIPYCDFNYHRGIVLNVDVCEERECRHYRRFYLSDAEKVFF